MKKLDKIKELEYVIGQWYEANEVCGFDTYTEKQSKDLKSFWLKMCENAK